MVRDETRVRVKLDTKQAKSELRGLVRESERSSGRVSSSVRGAISRGFGLVGAGAAFGTGLAAIRGATDASTGDVLGEALGGLGAQFEQWVFGDLAQDARASRAAREEAIRAFGMQAGATGNVSPGMKAWFDQTKALRMQEEKGRTAFEMDKRFRGPGIDEFIKRIGDKLGELLQDAVDALGNKLAFWR